MPFEENEYQHYLLKSGDVLINEGQSPELVGRAAIFRDDVQGACFQNSLIRFRASNLVLPEYALLIFRHYLHSGEFKKIARWTTNIAHLSLKRFAAMPFPLPPLSEQKQIVSEALGRLSAAHEQEVSVASSLENIARMREELYAAAISGSLSDQRPEDESANVLLSRAAADQHGPHDYRPSEAAVMTPADRRADRNATERNTSEEMGPVNNTRHALAQAIVAAGRPVTLAELYLLCGYDKDSVADIEQFYLRLKEELGKSIKHHSGQGEEIYLEVIEDATA
ncbi:restriction endonuclease subunit S [Streptomyces thinghirensis]|uniref:Type I restriction modification DNA specificity domain-containing protein n=1 Tax=Streptomyces thinghirensis TaxID=551547 RepID=A0ABP9T6B5_9ACTN